MLVERKVNIIVTEDLKLLDHPTKPPRQFINWHRGFLFLDQKALDSDIMEKCKNEQSGQRCNWSYEGFILDCREYFSKYMVIEVTDKDFLREICGFYNLDQLIQAFNKLCQRVKINSYIINPLSYYSDISLRKCLIQSYFKQHIAPKISEHSKSITSGDTYRVHIAGWGFIASFKPTILKDFALSKDIFWIKVFYSEEAQEAVKSGMFSYDSKIFTDKQDSSKGTRRYIDIFTSEKSQADLFDIIIPQDSKVFSVSLNELRNELVKFNII